MARRIFWTLALAPLLAQAQPTGVRRNADDAFGDLERESRRHAEPPLPPALSPTSSAPRTAQVPVAEPTKAEPTKAEPAKVAPTKAEPTKVEPTKAEPARTEPARTEPAQAEPAQAEPVRTLRPAAAVDAAALDRPVNLRQPDAGAINAAVLLATNAARAQHGLPALAPHPLLAAAAAEHAARMARLGFFSHDDPHDAGRRSPSDRARRAGIAEPFIAENIAISHATTGGRPMTYRALGAGVVQQWMNSPGHRANILSKSGLQMGAGVAGHPNGTQVTAVQKFQWFKPAPL